jgi:hypothetical protein
MWDESEYHGSAPLTTSPLAIAAVAVMPRRESFNRLFMVHLFESGDRKDGMVMDYLCRST